MSKINLKDLIYIVPDLIKLFLPGFVFLSTYNWLNTKEQNISLLTIWSLFITFLIETTFAVIHNLVLKNIDIGDSIKILIYVITGFALAFFFTFFRKNKYIQDLLLHFSNNKSVNDDIFDEIIDNDVPTKMYIYLKSSPFYYIGTFSCREEKGLNSWIVLIDYCEVHENSNTNLTKEFPQASIAINFQNIEKIKLIYSNNSRVWKHLNINNDYM